MSTNAVLLGIPLDLGAENLGVDVGPDAFRYHNLIDKLAGAGIKIRDAGNIEIKDRANLDPGNPKMRFAKEIIRVSKESAELTENVIKKGEKVIALGGDHSINLGVVAGASTALDGKIGLIYLDAHGDMNTPDTSLTGNVHGMHLAALLGYGPDELINVYGKGPKIQKNRLLHIGGSDMDQAELDLIEKENLDTFSLVDLLSFGLAPLFRKIDELSKEVSKFWVSLDLDVIDQLYAPAAGMPNRGGLTYREIAAIANYIGKQCEVIGIDVVEYNPLQDQDRKTAELGIELIAKFFGSNYSWYTNYLEHNKLGK